MKFFMKHLMVVGVVLAALSVPSQAQLAKGQVKLRSSSTENDRQAVADRLSDAQNRGASENRRLQQEGRELAAGDMPGRAQSAAEVAKLPPDPREQALSNRANASLATAAANLSDEGKALLAQTAVGGGLGQATAPKPLTVDPVPAAPGGKAPKAPAPSSADGPKPLPLKPTPLDDPAHKSASKTVINCTGAAYFDAKEAIAIFTDNVEVHHPQFFITCDEFEVHMVKDNEKKGEKAPPAPAAPGSGAPAPAAPAASGEPDLSDSGVKMAIARGKMVTIEKLTENGDIQVGKCKHATYIGESGDVILREWPQVQRGMHLQIATDASTRMILKQNGALQTEGPSRTEILQDPKKKAVPTTTQQ